MISVGNNLLETHTYDNCLHECKKELQDHISRSRQIDKSEKLQSFLTLLKELNSAPIQAQQNLNTIIQDFDRLGTGIGPNYDPTNDLDASDLLYLCCELCNNELCKEGARDLFVIQLFEMSSGMCPQGRTTRLFQIVSSFAEFFEDPQVKLNSPVTSQDSPCV